MPSTDAYTMRSEQLFARAEKVIPGGVNSPVRAFAAVGGVPRFVKRADGPYIWDVDGNRYVDYVMSWGPLIHGHAFPPVVDAIRQAASLGTSYGAPTESEVLLAEMVRTMVPSIDMVRFVNSGTEATMSALRLARGFTGRDLIVKFAGNYHGHADALLTQAGSGSLTLGIPSTPGVPSDTAKTTLVVPYNDVSTVASIFQRHGSKIAGVIVEPVAGNMGVVPPLPGFLEEIRRLTALHGSLFICDEVITGFRVSHGGAQQVLNFVPDLTTLGKVLGGGLPVGAYGGRRDVMQQVAPAGPVYQAGTLSGNPLAMAAGLVSLASLRADGFYERLASLTEMLARGLTAAAEQVGMEVTVAHVTGMLTLFFAGGPLHNLTDVQRSETVTYARFFHAMLRRGFYLPPSQFEAWMLSPCHSSQLITETISAATEALREITTQ